MSSYIHYELFLFFQSVAMGAMLLLCYSFLIALRQAVPHAGAVVMVQNLVFWIAAGFFVFVRIYRSNQGSLRNFLFLGLLLGAFLGNALLRPLFVKICGKILGIPVNAVKKIINVLLFLERRCKILISKTRVKRGRLFEKGREKEQKKENRV